jgi:protein-S-isoprenylcysteine O-methyltransferase Ste14
MNWENLPEKRMSRWGVGPVFAALSISYGLMTLLVSRYFHPVFQISFVPYSYLAILGVILIWIGVPFWIIAVRTIMRAYNANELVTGGVYRCCRHPVYSSWVVFIVPGIALLVSSWRIESSSQAFATGGIWLLLTIVFEFVFGHYVMGHPWSRLFRDYNLLKGRLWVLVLVWTAISPYVFHKIQS